MQKTKLPSLVVSAIFLITIFLPWVVIESKNIVISGVSAPGTTYGKPGYFNLIMVTLFVFFSFIPRNWAQRFNLFFAAFNMGWTLRNFVLLSVCQGGECPQRQPAFYVYLISGILLLVSIMLQKVQVKEEKDA